MTKHDSKTECRHISTQGKEDEKGSWCMDCGVKVYDVETRPCSSCSHFKKLVIGSMCKKHFMGVTPCMNVTFKIAEGTCHD